jgi:predicted membrane channel-forming protein YqfA (hemolysin III family)
VSCHSHHVARRCLKLDYLGIMFNISSTCISATYFGLYDQPFLANVYMTVILACGLAAFWAVLDPGADGPRAAKWRQVSSQTWGCITLTARIQGRYLHCPRRKRFRPYRAWASLAGDFPSGVLVGVCHCRIGLLPSRHRYLRQSNS